MLELDPSQFLAQGSSDDESDDDESIQNGNGPPILTSLGLTHINSVPSNPYSSHMVSLLPAHEADHVDYLLRFRIPMTRRTMTRAKCRVTGDVMRRFQPTVPCATCSSRIERTLVVTRRTFITYSRVPLGLQSTHSHSCKCSKSLKVHRCGKSKPRRRCKSITQGQSSIVTS